MTAYYNEIDRQKAAWLRELMKRNLIAPGEIDERSIQDVRPSDLAGFTQCHFFAGVGIWSYALRLAGYPNDCSVWTGSCPCQPFSAAGKRVGFADERHLWPAWFHLISECKPVRVFGEQTSGKDGEAWLDLVQSDMEAQSYAFGPLVLPAAGFGAPEMRHRIFFVADSDRTGCYERGDHHEGSTAKSALSRWQNERCGRSDAADGRNAGELGVAATGRRRTGRSSEPLPVERPCSTTQRSSIADNLEHAIKTRLEGHAGNGDRRNESRRQYENASGSVAASGPTRRVGDSEGDRRDGRAHDGNDGRRECSSRQASQISAVADSDSVFASDGELQRSRGFLQSEEDPLAGFWAGAEWLHCAPEKKYPEGRWRPVRPGTFPLAHGAPARVVRLRGYGDGIVAPVAQAFIESYLECLK